MNQFNFIYGYDDTCKSQKILFQYLGTACATLCASLSCLLGASRVLHAVGKDNLFGVMFSPFNWEYGTSHNPVVSVLFTSFIVALLFFFPSLNAISQVQKIP